MCELMTIAAAIAFTALYFGGKRKGRASAAAFTAMLMFWGAALMWSVDCIGSAMEGEGLLDMSREDAVLGGIILAAGFALYAVLLAFERIRATPARHAT